MFSQDFVCSLGESLSMGREVSVWGGGSLSGEVGLCLGRGSLSGEGGLCMGRGSLSMGSLSREGVSVQEGLCQGDPPPYGKEQAVRHHTGMNSCSEFLWGRGVECWIFAWLCRVLMATLILFSMVVIKILSFVLNLKQ